MAAPIVRQAAQSTRSSLLRMALRTDAAFCALTGATSVVLSGQLAALLGAGTSAVFIALGVVMIAYAGWLFRAAAAEHINRRNVWLNIILGLVWIVDSVALLVSGWLPLTPTGIWLIVGLADVVALFAIVQVVALRRTR